jgi:hypothetical protein
MGGQVGEGAPILGAASKADGGRLVRSLKRKNFPVGVIHFEVLSYRREE